MIDLRRILCPVDFSDATPHGVRPAVSLATEYGAELYLLHVLDFPHPHLDALGPSFDVMPYYEEMEVEAGRRLAELVDEEARQFADLNATVRRGTPFMEIIDFAKDEDIDLIVIPTQGRTGVDRFLFGSVTEKVLRMAPCPVLTIPPREGEPEAFTIDKVLHPTDFSDYSDHALPYAVSFAKRYDAGLLMVHVVTVWDYDPANPEWRFPPLEPEHQRLVEENAQQTLEEHGGKIESDVHVEERLVKGFDPPMEICRVAEEEDVDVIVMATHGRTGLRHALLGSTAEKVARHSERPVFTVKHPEHEFVVP